MTRSTFSINFCAIALGSVMKSRSVSGDDTAKYTLIQAGRFIKLFNALTSRLIHDLVTDSWSAALSAFRRAIIKLDYLRRTWRSSLSTIYAYTIKQSVKGRTYC